MRVEVRCKVTGLLRGDGVPHVLIELAAQHTTVRELISRAVEEQVRLLAADAARRQSALDRQYLSADDIRAQAATGAVRMPRQVHGEPDSDAEVARAHRAFERNVFAVFVGGRQADRLDEEVVLRPGEPVVFLRLTPLVGG